MLLVPFLALVLATILDLRTREIPDAIPIVVIGWAVGATAFGISPHGWISMMLGLGFGAATGLLLFWFGGFGGGDAKLLAGVGAAVGPRALPVFLFYAAIGGGVLALVALVRGKRDLAYAPAMAIGLLVFMMIRGVR